MSEYRMIDEHVGSLDVSDIKLTDIIKECEALISIHGVDTFVNLEQDVYSDYSSVVVRRKRKETDEEMKMRLGCEEYSNSQIREREIKQMYRLIEKYQNQKD